MHRARRGRWTAWFAGISIAVSVTPSIRAQDEWLMPAPSAIRGVWPAPAGTWPTQDGSLARSRATATELPSGPLELAFALTLGGECVGEPVVDGRWAVVAVRALGRDELVLVDLARGERVGAALPVQGVTPEPCLVGGRVAFRAAPDAIAVATVDERGFSVERRWTLARAGPPLFDGTTIWCASADRLARFSPENPKPIAEPTLTVYSRLAIANDRLHALVRTSAARSGLMTFPLDLSFGELVEFVPLDGMAQSVPLHPGRGVTRFDARPFKSPEFPPGWVAVGGGWGFASANESRFDGFSFRLVHPPAAAEDGALGWIHHPDSKGVALALDVDGSGGRFLVELQSRSVVVAPVIAANGIVIDHRAADPTGTDVLWTLPQPALSAVVPTNHGVLVRREGGVLELYRGRHHRVVSDGWAAWPTGDEWSAALADPRAVAVGSAPAVVLTGPLVVDEEGLLRTEDEPPKRGRRPPAPTLTASGVTAFVARDGDHVHALDFAALAAATALYLDHDRREVLARVLPAATASLDVASIDGLADVARAVDDAKALQRLSAARERAVKAARGADAGHVETVRKGLEELAARTEDVRGRALRSVMRASDGAAFDLLAAAARDPGWRPSAEAQIAERLPDGVVFRAEQLDGFVELARLHERRGISIVRPPAGEGPDTSPDARRVGRVAAHWRREVLGFRTPDVLVVTPLDDPVALAACLADGQLLCETLRSIFESALPAGTPARSGATDPLVVRLYGNRTEYLALSSTKDAAGAAAAAGGFYDARQRENHFLAPADGTTPQARRTFLHEFTHQWVVERGPLTDPAWISPDGRGYWIVEGFATFVEGWELDTRAWRVRGHDAPLDWLDIVASVPPGEHLPWTAFLTETHAWAAATMRMPVTHVAMRRRLAPKTPISGSVLYHAQGAALAGALFHAEDPKLRGALFTALKGFYTGDPAARVELLTGLTPERLGELAVAYAQAVVER